MCQSPLCRRFPSEILIEIAAHLPDHLCDDLVSFSQCCKSLHRNVALRSIYVDTPEKGYGPCCTNAALGSKLFHKLFSSSAVRRRSFCPDLQGFADQFVAYCQTLKFFRSRAHDRGRSTAHESDGMSAVQAAFLMLMECDGRNSWQLDWAGCYEYCERWLWENLYEVQNGQFVRDWPRDDHHVSYALWCMYRLTTDVRLRSEPTPQRIKFLDLLAPFVLVPHRYPRTYAPVHNFNLPMPPDDRIKPQSSSASQFDQDDGPDASESMDVDETEYDTNLGDSAVRDGEFSHPASQAFDGAIRVSVPTAMPYPYPVYMHPEAPHQVISTNSYSFVYYGRRIPMMAPLLGVAASLLYFVRKELPKFFIPPDISRSRDEFMGRRSHQVQIFRNSNVAADHTFQLIESTSLQHVRQLIRTQTLPAQIMQLPGAADAIDYLGAFTGVNGDDPAFATGPIKPDFEWWNARRETALPFRGGIDEDGKDPANVRLRKLGAEAEEQSPVESIEELAGPWKSGEPISQMNDTMFWRLVLCGNMFVEGQGIFDLLSSDQLRQYGLNRKVRDSWLFLKPGRTFDPFAISGQWQGRILIGESRRVVHYPTDPQFPFGNVGTNIELQEGAAPLLTLQMNIRAHVLMARNRTEAVTSDEEYDRLEEAATVPCTCDSRTFPRRTVPAGEEMPLMFPGDVSVLPEDKYVVDEGVCLGHLPLGFRYRDATVNGHPGLMIGAGPPGDPSSDNIYMYETLDRSTTAATTSHDFSACAKCERQRSYLDHLQKVQIQEQRMQEQARRLFAREGFGTEDEEDVSGDEPFHSPDHIHKCDGILDLVITGETDRKDGEAWNHFRFFGRVRRWDGLVCILRIPKDEDPASGMMTIVMCGYLENDRNFTGTWRIVTGGRIFNDDDAPPRYDASGGFRGAGLRGEGGAGVLAEGTELVWEGVFTASRIFPPNENVV